MGIIELGIFANLNNINISVYTINHDNDNVYAHFINIWKDENINQFLLANYQNGNHFDFLKIKTNTLKPCLIPLGTEPGNFFAGYKIPKNFKMS